MNNFIRIVTINLLLISYLLFPSQLSAQELQLTLPSLETPSVVQIEKPIIMPVNPGDKILWSGLLLNPSAVAQIKVNLDSQKEQCKLDITKEVDLAKANFEFQRSVLQIENDRKKIIYEATIKSKIEENNQLHKLLEIKENEKPNIYLWTGLGVIGGITITILTTIIVTHAN